jgi:hypothetical protein
VVVPQVRNLIMSAGVILIAAGIALLVWSRTLAAGTNTTAGSSWWIGTLQALGVGFVVGGLVDVLAISGLAGATKAEGRKRNEAITRAQDILTTIPSEASREAAARLVDESFSLLPVPLREKLLDYWAGEPKDWKRGARP